MLNHVKRHRYFFVALQVVLAVCIWRVIHYYTNGQAIASAHMEGHSFAFFVNIFIAIIIVFVFVAIFLVIKFIAKKDYEKMAKWLLLPAVFIAYAPMHLIVENF